MTSTQRVIKGLAIALATFIIILIASSIIGVISLFSNVFDIYEGNDTNGHISLKEYENVKNLDIDLRSANLEIYEDDKFKVELNNSKIFKVNQYSNTIKIKENSPYFWTKRSGTVKIYVPKNTLENIDLDIDAGRLTIENLSAKSIDLDHGAGYVLMQNSEFKKTEIEGGAGKLEIQNSKMTDLDFKTGVGKTIIKNSQILGKSKIDMGVGNVSIELDSIKEDYTLKLTKGIGSIQVNNEEASGTIGSGPNTLTIDGGVGSINLDFKKNN